MRRESGAGWRAPGSVLMADPLYFSLWLKDFREETMLKHFATILSAFPFSSFTPGVQSITVRAISDAEPELLEENFEEPATAEQALNQAAQFLHDDGAYELTAYWDLWQKVDGEWLLRPQQTRLSCFGPLYENEMGDHIRMALGWDYQFLPDPADPPSITPTASNLRSVSRLAQSLQSASGVERRLLWSPSDESFLRQLEETVLSVEQERPN